MGPINKCECRSAGPMVAVARRGRREGEAARRGAARRAAGPWGLQGGATGREAFSNVPRSTVRAGEATD